MANIGLYSGDLSEGIFSFFLEPFKFIQSYGLLAQSPFTASDAVSISLSQFIRENIKVLIPGGSTQDSLESRVEVFSHFPTSFESMRFPCISISELSLELDETDKDSEPELVDTVNELGLLTKRAFGRFHVDLWANSDIQRMALKKAFYSLFQKHYTSGGKQNQLKLDLVSEYIPRIFEGKYTATALIDLESQPKDMHNVWPTDSRTEEWRATASLFWEADELIVKQVYEYIMEMNGVVWETLN